MPLDDDVALFICEYFVGVKKKMCDRNCCQNHVGL